jgi:hypothetical protein
MRNAVGALYQMFTRKRWMVSYQSLALNLPPRIRLVVPLSQGEKIP